MAGGTFYVWRLEGRRRRCGPDGVALCFFLGLVVLTVFLFCSFFEIRQGSLVSHRWERSKRDMFAIAFAASLAALLLNPVGIKLVVYPLDLMFNQSTNLNSVDEWLPLTF